MMITSTTTASIILGVSYLKFKQVVFSGDYVLRILLGIALIMWVSSVTYRIKIGNKFSKLLGRISYEIFLLHGFSMSFFSQGSFGLSSGQFIILTFLLTVLLAYILNKIDNTISNMVKEFDFSKA